jgi:hypothetical protein
MSVKVTRQRVDGASEHPAREGDGVEVHERHRPRERSDAIGDAELDVACSPSSMLEDDGVMKRGRLPRS